MHRVTFDDGEAVAASSVIIATGARYNRLALDRLAEFEGVGVYYATTQAEAQACGTGPAAVVEGGNSAGQAALFLSRSCSAVHLIIRRDSLGATRRQGQPEASELAVTGLFVFVGAEPGTGWLAGQLAEDRHGFLLTGSHIPATRQEDRNPTPLFL